MIMYLASCIQQDIFDIQQDIFDIVVHTSSLKDYTTIVYLLSCW